MPAKKLIATVSVVIQVVDDPTADVIQANFADRLGGIREILLSFSCDLSRHQLSPASHIFVFMISIEARNIGRYLVLQDTNILNICG